MPQCVTCGCELHPERALKYNYCMARECQDKNAKGLTMVAVGVNKAAEQYLILDERTPWSVQHPGKQPAAPGAHRRSGWRSSITSKASGLTRSPRNSG
jgi:hypothetical protein